MNSLHASPMRRATRASAILFVALSCAISLARGEPQPRAPLNLCIDDTGHCAPDKPELGQTFKWHPGNYMLVFPDAPQSNLDDLRNEPTVRGAQIRYDWAELEPRKGEYDFSAIESDLRYLQSMSTPKRLVIQVMDRKFNTSARDGFVPQYLIDDPQYGGGIARTRTGYVARIWDPQVMDREIALYEALAKRFNSEPYFEGITTEETSMGFASGSEPADYSRGALASQLKRLMTSARAAWRNTNVFLYTNYLVGEVQGLVKHAHDNRCGVGGPDITPRAPTAGARVLMGIDGGVRYVGKTPVAFAVQTPELCGKEGCNSPANLYDYAVNSLGANYIFWVRFGTMKDTATEKYSWQYGMLPVIRANGGRTISACPLNLLGSCTQN